MGWRTAVLHHPIVEEDQEELALEKLARKLAIADPDEVALL
jgi:hypothetical protein